MMGFPSGVVEVVGLPSRVLGLERLGLGTRDSFKPGSSLPKAEQTLMVFEVVTRDRTIREG